MSKRRKPPRVPSTPKDRTIGLLPLPRPGADERVRLGLRLRNEATLTGHCACGARRETFEVRDDGSFVPAETIERGKAYYARFEHEDDCPAISPEIDRALERGEISDPGGDLFEALRREKEERL